MNEGPVYLRVVSLHLSRTLDEIGLNRLTVNKRRHAFLYNGQLASIYASSREKECSIYHFGSQTEGSTTPGLNSDVDGLMCCNQYNVIPDWSEWEHGKENLLMLQENTAPGYCRLQLLRRDIPMGREDLPDENFTYDSSGRVILKNTSLNSNLTGQPTVRNGPARSMGDRPGWKDVDLVIALKSSSWPGQAGEFTRRRRRYCWPSQNLLKEAVGHGVFLVPVGYKLSPTEHLEWRISASLAERCLMFSLNIVHIKCYVVLKMLIKTFVEPHVKKCISSYHCKTAVLYCTENTESGFWRDDNILQCVTRCLLMLLAWVSNGFCPQFIISKENLFAGKITALNKGILQSIFTELIKSNGGSLLRVRIDDLGHKLQAKLNTEPSALSVVDSLASMGIIGELELEKQGRMDIFTKTWLVDEKDTKPNSAIRSVYQRIGLLKGLMGQSNKHEQQAIQVIVEFLSSWLGSLLASVSLSRKTRIPRKALQLLRIGATSDVATMLKLASVFYCNEECRKAETILQKVEDHFCRNEIQLVCECYLHPDKQSPNFCHMMYVLRSKKARAKLFAHCVRFSPQEIHCAPPALRTELFRSVGDDIQHRDPEEDDWMFLAVADYLPFLYYLQYITYRQLGKHDQQTRSLHSLGRCIREDNDFRHLETAWNLLGQCLELEQEPEAAMTCYRTSLEIRPRNNAANWHVQNLCYTRIRDGCLPV